MLKSALYTDIQRLHKKLNGCRTEFDIKPYESISMQVEQKAAALVTKTDDDLKMFAQGLENRACAESLDNLLIDSFALVYESIRRTLGITPFRVQIIGGIVLYKGKIAEMQTGEGKTLTACFPAFLKSLEGKGVHVLTFNDYLAHRDAKWMGPVYEFLGRKVSYIDSQMDTSEKQLAYSSDITYLTAKQAGFDFLKDSLCYSSEDFMHKGLNYAIVDEADSILIDEARVPLVIAGTSNNYNNADLYAIAKIVKDLTKDSHFQSDEYARNIFLTEEGIQFLEHKLNCGNLYESDNYDLLAQISYALHAEHLLHVDKDYVIKNGIVEQIDEFTGRIAHKRRWPDGLQAAVEAKENCAFKCQGKIFNSITLQHFLAMYSSISGMTATAQVAEEELRAFYNLHVVVIPPNKACIRIDKADLLFATKEQKRHAIIEEICKVHKTQRPILVGTQTVKESAELYEELKSLGITCKVLNAKNDSQEADIIAEAGRLGSITISTNMAGRGTDIRLGGSYASEHGKVAALGGLYVIGTDRHESKRIDNQLRGRAGRQGDPGSSRFFISLDDDLFLKYRLRDLLPSDMIIEKPQSVSESKLVAEEVNRTQRIVEGQNLDIKTTLYKYSIILEQQRRIIKEKRDNLLSANQALSYCREICHDKMNLLLTSNNAEKIQTLCKYIALYHVDTQWSNYLAEVNELKENIHLRRIGGQDPLFEFRKITIEMFNKLMILIDHEICSSLEAIDVNDCTDNHVNLHHRDPSATWTYLINDDPFEHKFGLEMVANVGLSAWAGLLWPLLIITHFVKRCLSILKKD